MSNVERCLLAMRVSDGKFLRLKQGITTTSYDFVSDPEKAERIIIHDLSELRNPHHPAYYFENSYRARELWTKGCVMVPYEITTVTIAIMMEF